MKSKEELNVLKEEVETLNKKLHELTDEELAQVSGGNCYLSFRYGPNGEFIIEPFDPENPDRIPDRATIITP